MKLAFPSDGKNIDSSIDLRFGRCPYFVIYDTETKTSDFIENTQHYQAVQGAGIQSATHIVNKKADVCITAHCGPKAFRVFNTAGIRVVTGAKGSVKDAIADFEQGKMSYASSADVDGHWV